MQTTKEQKRSSCFYCHITWQVLIDASLIPCLQQPLANRKQKKMGK
jgi:hypothetical protein